MSMVKDAMTAMTKTPPTVPVTVAAVFRLESAEVVDSMQSSGLLNDWISTTQLGLTSILLFRMTTDACPLCTQPSTCVIALVQFNVPDSSARNNTTLSLSVQRNSRLLISVLVISKH